MTASRADGMAVTHGSPLWTVAQVSGVVLTAVLLWALVWAPQPTLTILWNAVIPILPAAFLVSPALWRNVCPLATLNLLTARFGFQHKLEPVAQRRFGMVGIVLLLVMVPARRFIFNVHGPVLAGTIVVVALLALLLGLAFSTKAGFCNALCPVLPVERLYGQRPMLRVPNPRCAPCTLCTTRGCVDLTPRRTVSTALGARAGSAAWLLTSFGAFAAAFPGFIVGYYTTVDGPLTSALGVYRHVGLYALVSYALVAALVLGTRIASDRATLLIAAACVSLYYWFAATAVADALGLPQWWVVGVRVAALALVALWLGRAVRPEPSKAGAHA